MGVYDCIRGVPDTHDNQVKIWSRTLKWYEVGSIVPPIGEGSYYVKLKPNNSWQDPIYVKVVKSKIVSIGMRDYDDGLPVINKWGELTR